MASLLTALGTPPSLRVVPSARSRDWRHASKLLHSALRRIGHHANFRSWQALWCLIHSTSAPVRTTWDELCDGFLLSDVAKRLADTRVNDIRIAVASWNVRWLIDQQTRTATQQRQVI